MWSDYKILKLKASTLTSEVEDITYIWSCDTTDDYGLLADILGTSKYDNLTNINTYAASTKPVTYMMPHSHMSESARR